VIRRFAVLGDIHAEDVRLEGALRAIASARVDAVLSVGDVVDGVGNADRAIELLASHGVITVRGNHDRWILHGGLLSDAERAQLGWSIASRMKATSIEWLRKRPATETLDTIAGPLLLCHAIGEDDMTKLYASDPMSHDNEDVQDIVRTGRHRLVVCGHTHERWITRFDDVRWLNAGTLSERGNPGFLLVDLAARLARFYDVSCDGVVTDADVHELTAAR
jgi:predicted phosphodiesterase